MSAAELVGREAELEALTALLEQVRSGHAGAAFVCGEAGIGKTSLVEALVSAARKSGLQTVWGRCWEGGGASPYGPWVQVLGLIDGTASDILRPPSQTRQSETPDARLGMFDAVGQLLRGMARAEGLVVALDDLHAADEASLHLLRFLVRASPWARLLIVGTYRTTEAGASPGHQALLDALSQHALTIRLTGLGPADVASLLARAGAPADASTASQVHAATGGNPLLVQEAGRLMSRPTASDAELALSSGGPALMGQRLGSLPASVRRVLAAAAVLGPEFALGPLSAMTDRPPDDTLDELATAADLAMVADVGLGRWCFTHALVREALMDALTTTDRARLHRRAGEILGQTGGADVWQVAHHLFQALGHGESVSALDACAAAAEAATACLAHEDAVLWFRRAIEAADISAPEDGRRRCELLVGLGEALLQLGAIGDAQDAFRGAITSAQALGSVEMAAEAAVRIAPYAISDAAVIGALDDALCDLPEDDSPLRARVLVSFARVMQSSSVGGAVLRNVNRMGLEMARRIGDPRTLWATLWQWHQNGFNGIEPVDGRLAVARELIAMAEEAGDRERVTLARTWLAVDLYEAGNLGAARAELGAVLRDAEELRQPFLSWAALAFASQVALFEGRLAEAEALAQQAFDAGSECRTTSAEMILNQQLAAVRRHQGRFGELEQIARRALRQWMPGGYDCRHNPLLVALVGLGRAEEAGAHVDEMLRYGVVETLFPVIVPDSERSTTGRLCCPVGMAEVLWMLDDVDRARPLYEMLLPSAGRHVLIMEGESRGVCALYLGQLATLLGQFAEADAHFRMAHELHERIGARVWGAHGRVDHARMLIQRGEPDDRGRARALLVEAVGSYEAMTMDFYATRAGEVLEKLAPPAVG